MAKQLFKNNAASNISGTLTQGGTTITLATGTGDEFPTPSGGDYFLLTLFEKDESGVEERIEIVKVTARTADTLTVVRDFESMTGQSGGFAYPSAANRTVYAELRFTSAAAINLLQSSANLSDLSDVETARTNLDISATNTPFTPTSTIAATNVQEAIAELAAEKEEQDATLDALAGLTTAANKLPYFTGEDVADVTDLTVFGRSLIDDVDAATARSTLGLGTAAVQADTYFALATRTISPGTGLSGGGDLSTNRTISLANTTVVASSYGSATQAGTFTVDAQGRLTAASSVTITPAWGSITSKPTTISGYGITDAQPLDADLTAIAGISATSGLLKKTAANSWTLDTNTYLTGNQTISVSGDATGSGATAIALTLANSGVTAGTYNNSATANIPITVDAKGRITATGTAVTITPAWSSITSKPTTISGYGITDAQPLDADLTAIAALTGTAGFLKTSGAGVWTVDTNTYLTTGTAASTYLTTATASTTYQPVSARNAANGYAGLDGAGLIPSTLLPSYVDDVLEYPNLDGFPATGETGKIYVALDTNKCYRWSGSAYVYITSGAVDSVAGKTGVVTLVKGDVGLGNVENTALSTWAGTSKITTLGTIGTGTWNATTIAVAKGGTGATTLTGLVYGNGTSAMTAATAAQIVSAIDNTAVAKATDADTLDGNHASAFYLATNPSGYTTNTGTVTSVATSGAITGGTITTTGTISHSTADGFLHVPATSTTNNGNVLVAGATAGSFSWQVPSLTLIPDAWVKKSVRCATTANITLSGTQTIDGIAVVAGDRVLVKDQTTASQNGIYVASATAWARATDADGIGELAGACVNVDSGTVNGGFRFDTDLKATDTLGTTAVSFYRVFDANDSATANTANKLVLRDASGNFSAGTITAALSGNATTATTLQTTRTIWGQNFNGSANVTGNLTSVGNITGTGAVALTATSGTLALAATGANVITASTNATERMRIDSSGNVGIGVTPSPWSIPAIQSQYGTLSGISQAQLSANYYYNSGDKYYGNGLATIYTQSSGLHKWYIAPNNTSGAGASMSLTQAMTLDASGNLGIGTSSPIAKLDVNGAGRFGSIIDMVGGAGSTLLRFYNNSRNYSIKNDVSGSFLAIRDESAAADRLIVDSAGNLGLGVTPSAWDVNVKAIQQPAGSVFSYATTEMHTTFNAYFDGAWKYKNSGYASDYRQYAGQHIWQTAPSGTAGNPITFTQAMTLDASGNLGVGTSSPAYKLHVQSTLDPVIGVQATTAGYPLGFMQSGNGAVYVGASGAYPYTFYTNGSERMRIDSGGNLLVGTTTTTAYFDGKLNVAGRLHTYVTNGADRNYFWNAASSGTRYFTSFVVGPVSSPSVVGNITSDGTTTTYGTSSDYRLKENIQPMQNALDVVAQLNPVTYTWKADGSDGQGFIAHELQAVVPDCVTGEKDAVDAEGKPVYQGIDTSFLVATLTKAIQEQQEQINQLKAEVAALKGN